MTPLTTALITLLTLLTLLLTLQITTTLRLLLSLHHFNHYIQHHQSHHYCCPCCTEEKNPRKNHNHHPRQEETPSIERTHPTHHTAFVGDVTVPGRPYAASSLYSRSDSLGIDDEGVEGTLCPDERTVGSLFHPGMLWEEGMKKSKTGVEDGRGDEGLDEKEEKMNRKKERLRDSIWSNKNKASQDV